MPIDETSTPEIWIRPTEVRDAAAHADFLLAHMAESGKDGSPVFAPGHRPSRSEMMDSAAARWARKLTQPMWGRQWFLVSRDRGIVGHIELRGGRIPPELHRATLGMGILRDFTGKGHGKRLLDTAITWAREETSLVWIDLGVFAGNEPARKLYARYGFVEQHTRADAFRHPDAGSIDDIQMTFALRA
ncbi:MAG: GNAT family N-acetyltransferase [Polyangiaceae bacterium]